MTHPLTGSLTAITAAAELRPCPTCGADRNTLCRSLNGNELPIDRSHVDRALPAGAPTAPEWAETRIRAAEREDAARRVEAWAATLTGTAALTALDAAAVIRQGR
jgi:hypothetical protein